MSVKTAKAMLTIYRAKDKFHYNGRTIGKDEQWTPDGLRNDKHIQKYLCYPVQVPLSDLLNEESDVKSDEGATKSTGATKKKTTRARGRKAQSKSE